MREITSKYKVQYPLNKDLTETQIQILSLKKKKKKKNHAVSSTTRCSKLFGITCPQGAQRNTIYHYNKVLDSYVK